MAPGGTIATAALLCFLLALLGPAPAALGSHTGKACCTSYNRRPVPFQRIKGYREQSSMESCHIEAIIFYTVKKKEICATRRDEWVRKILELLSSKLKMMSKAGSAAGQTPMRKRGKPSVSDGSGSFFGAIETFPNSTGRFY